MKPRIFDPVLMGLVMLVMFDAGQASAAGFVNNGVGIRGTSMGSAFHGIADDSSAIHYNPAGLALIEPGQLSIEGSATMVFSKFTYTNTTPAGTTEHESKSTAVIPCFFLSQSFDRWGLGVGFYVPYGGGGVNYKEFFPSGDSLEGSGGLSAFSASGAVEIVRQYLSIGVTPSLYVGSMGSKVNPPEDPSGQTRVTVENSGFAGFGASLGIMSQPLPELRLGLTLRSPVKVKLDGTITTDLPIPGAPPMEADSTTEFTIPPEASLGLGSTPVPGLTLGLSGSIVFHGMMDKYTTHTTAPNPATGEEEDVTSVSETHYHHNFRVGLGAEYMFIKQLGLRGGMQFVQSPLRDNWLVPISNDVSEIVLALGATWNIVDFLALDVTGERIFGLEREQERTAQMTESFDADHWVLLTGLRFNWDFVE